MDKDWKVIGAAARGTARTWIGPGLAVPHRFEVVATREPLDAKLTVIVEDGKAALRQVCITNLSGDVTTSEMRTIPLRALIADGMKGLFWKADPGGELKAGAKHDERSLAAIRKAVRYVGVSE